MASYPTLKFSCPVRWESLKGDEKQRFCEHCQKSVTNLSAMSETERVDFLAETREKPPCVSYLVPRPAQPCWRTPLAWWSALVASSGLAVASGCSRQTNDTLTGRVRTAGTPVTVASQQAPRIMGKMPPRQDYVLGLRGMEAAPKTSAPNPLPSNQGKTQ